MRDLALVLGMLFYLPMSLRAPAAGLLCWTWFSIMNPHREVYGFAYGQPFSMVIAVATLVGWLFSDERKRWTPDLMPKLLLLLLAWMAVDTFFGVNPGYSLEFLDRTARVFALTFMAFVLITNKARIHGMVWTIIISLGFYGVKGGVFTIVNGGHAIVFGPPASVYTDNNQLALAIVSTLPLVYYVWSHTRAAWLRIPTLVALVLQIIMVFGSYSRGGVIALSVMLGMFWLRSDRKIVYGLLGAVVVAGSLSLMPDEFFDRLHTVNSLDSDDSFQGRVNAWIVAFHYANDHFPFGAGFNGATLKTTFAHYLPGVDAHAAHSIYFQILGDHGYIGLALFLVILLLGLYNAGVVIRQTRNVPELAWARDLAEMMRISLISFYVGGAALSMAYSDVYLLMFAMLSTLRQLTEPGAAEARERARLRRQSARLMPGREPVRV